MNELRSWLLALAKELYERLLSTPATGSRGEALEKAINRAGRDQSLLAIPSDNAAVAL